MNVLELFAGARCIGRVAEELGCAVYSVDWENFYGVHLNKDIEFLRKYDIPFIPDYIHASFDCTTYTIAAISHHRNGTEPKSEYAKKCDRVNKRVIELIKEYQKINPDLIFTFENPRGMLRKMPFMQEFERTTVWYCTYGDNRAKPTDIWTNNLYSVFNQDGWKPRPVCHNGNKNCHHESAPRGSKTGTQGRKGSYERSKIPYELCKDLIESAIRAKNIRK